MPVPDVRATTPAQRGRALSRAVGVKRRLELRQRDGLLTAVQAAELRKARLTVAALHDLDVALRGTELTFAQARTRREELRRQLGMRGKPRKGIAGKPRAKMSEAERVQAREELRTIDDALAKDAASTLPAAQPATRAQPTRVTSVVNGGSPGLGRR